MVIPAKAFPGPLVFLLLSLCGPAALVAQDDTVETQTVETQMKTLRIPRVSRPPELSDFLNEVPREAELEVSDFRHYYPGDGIPVSKQTTAYLSYDEKNLYVVFVCKDDPKLLRARVAKHDQIMRDDRTSVNLDTFRDRRTMYWFNVNPYGVMADGVSTEGSGTDVNWDTLWHSEAKITDDGYVTMTVIPFKSLRFPNDDEQTWGLIIGRLIPRNNEYSTWPYVSRRRTGFAQQGGDLEGLRDISPGRNIQLIPYGLASRSRYLDAPPGGAPGFQTESEVRVGLDSKVILKDALTLDVTINPDFSQVESDEPQVTLNERYEVYFPEKRPFFMDNSGYFATPLQVFFSRRVVDPRFGVRLSGKVGDWSVGALFADDRAPGDNVAEGDPLRGRHAPVGVVRLLREFRHNSRNSHIGATVTSLDFGTSYNRVYSVDTRLQLLRNWIFTGQAATSNTRLTNGQNLAGPTYYASWDHSGRHFVSSTKYTDISPTFRAQLGFFRRLDIRQVSHTVGYTWRPETGLVQSFGPRFGGSINYDRQGRLRDWDVTGLFNIALSRATQLTLSHYEFFELYRNAGFRQHLSAVSFASEWLKWFRMTGSFSRGVGINYSPGPRLEPFMGERLQGNMNLTLYVGPRLRLDETYIYSGLRTSSASGLFDYSGGTVIFDNHIIRSKANYQFSKKLSLRFIFDYNSVLPNSTLVAAEEKKHIGVDALFTYQLNPLTALHCGYTDLYDNLRLDQAALPALYRTASPNLNTGRQVFAKLSYLIRF